MYRFTGILSRRRPESYRLRLIGHRDDRNPSSYALIMPAADFLLGIVAPAGRTPIHTGAHDRVSRLRFVAPSEARNMVNNILRRLCCLSAKERGMTKQTPRPVRCFSLHWGSGVIEEEFGLARAITTAIELLNFTEGVAADTRESAFAITTITAVSRARRAYHRREGYVQPAQGAEISTATRSIAGEACRGLQRRISQFGLENFNQHWSLGCPKASGSGVVAGRYRSPNSAARRAWTF
jgi:hypothetical protein